MIKHEIYYITDKEYNEIEKVISIRCGYNVKLNKAFSILNFLNKNDEECSISVWNDLNEVVQPERLSEEGTVTKCKECHREFLPDCLCDSPN